MSSGVSFVGGTTRQVVSTPAKSDNNSSSSIPEPPIDRIADDSPMADKKKFFESFFQKDGELRRSVPSPRGWSPRHTHITAGSAIQKKLYAVRTPMTAKMDQPKSASHHHPWKKSPASSTKSYSASKILPSGRPSQTPSTSSSINNNSNVSPAPTEQQPLESPLFSELQHMWDSKTTANQNTSRGRTPSVPYRSRPWTPGSREQADVRSNSRHSTEPQERVHHRVSRHDPPVQGEEEERATRNTVLPDPPEEYQEEKKDDPEEMISLPVSTRHYSPATTPSASHPIQYQTMVPAVSTSHRVLSDETPRFADLRLMWTTNAAPPSAAQEEQERLPPVVIPEVSPTHMSRPVDNRTPSQSQTELLPDSMDRARYLSQASPSRYRSHRASHSPEGNDDIENVDPTASPTSDQEYEDFDDLEGEEDDDEEPEDVFTTLRTDSLTTELEAMQTSANSMMGHAKRSHDKYQAMLELTKEYRSSPKEEETGKETKEVSPVSQYIQKFEAFSKGEKVPMNNNVETENDRPKKFSYYDTGSDTLDILNNIAEPINHEDAFEADDAPVVPVPPTQVEAIMESTPSPKVEELVKEKEDEIVRASQEKDILKAVRKAAAKISKSGGYKESTATEDSKPSKPKEEPDTKSVQDDNPNDSIMTDNLTMAAGMDTSLALDQDTYDSAMVLVNLNSSKKPTVCNTNDGKANKKTINTTGKTASSRQHAPDSPMAEPQSKCGAGCVVM